MDLPAAYDLLKGHSFPQSPPQTNSHKDGRWASMVVHNHPSAILLLKYIGGHSPAQLIHPSRHSTSLIHMGFAKYHLYAV